jgi:hypothetical protein
VTQARYSTGGGFITRQRHPGTTIDTQADWKHPLARGQLLALGTSWHRDSTTQDYSLATTNTDGTPGAGAADHFDGSSRTWAAYATFQQTLGAVTLEPGCAPSATCGTWPAPARARCRPPPAWRGPRCSLAASASPGQQTLDAGGQL